MDRRSFVKMMAVGAASPLLPRAAFAQSVPQAQNVVLVHGLFADGSCWTEVIPRLQAAGLNVTSVQNPLTTLDDAVASAQRVLARQDGPTVLAGHSFSGMIVTEAGVDPKVSAVVYVAARAPDAGEDYGALAQKFPTPPASAGIVFDGDEGRLTEAAFLRDFAGSHSTRLCSPARRRMRRGDRSRASMRSRRKTGRSILISSASWQSVWALKPSRLRRAISRSSRSPRRLRTSSWRRRAGSDDQRSIACEGARSFRYARLTLFATPGGVCPPDSRVYCGDAA
jgi:pimeloyl-ACP methyl ester carboxylesterase